MKPIRVGRNAEGEAVFLSPEQRQATHMHVIGGSGTGKSKFLEALIREDIRAGHGVCLIDWHGTLYTDVLRYCAHLDVGLYKDFRGLVLLDPSRSEFVTGFNPFMNRGEDVSAQVSRRVAATIRPWGMTNTDAMPTFERVARLLYTFAVESGQPLPNAAKLLEFERPELRAYAAERVTDEYIQAQWRQLEGIRSARDWREMVLSTENRLTRFLGSTGVKRFMGLAEGNIDLLDIMDNGKILLVNLGASDWLDREAARVFASLLLNEFFETAMRRANRSRTGEKPRHFMLYLDEFQEYITEDIAGMLDQVRKGGLHLVLAHQHLAHLEKMPTLLDSVLTNARLRAVFGGLPYKSAELLANEMFLPDLNSRQIKKAYYHTIHLYEEQTRTIRSHTSGHGHSSGSSWSTAHGSVAGASVSSGASGSSPTAVPEVEGWFSSKTTSSSSSESSSLGGSDSDSDFESQGETVVPVWVPIPTQELGSEVEWSREEKVSKVVQTLKEQMQRHCFIKLDTEKTQPLLTPFVRDYSIAEELLSEYERDVYRAQDALPAAEIDVRLTESAQRFLNEAKVERAVVDPPVPDRMPARSKAISKKPTGLKSTPWDDIIGPE